MGGVRSRLDGGDYIIVKSPCQKSWLWFWSFNPK